MGAPFVRSTGPVVSSYGPTLDVPIGPVSVGDLVLIYTDNTNWASANVGRPAPPLGFKEMYGADSSGAFQVLYWAKVVNPDAFGTARLSIPQGSGWGGSWVAFAEVIANVSYRTPGWISLPGTVGNYARLDRSDLPSAASLGFAVRVQLDVLGVAQWFTGFGADAGFGLDSSNRPIVYANNTLGNPVGNLAANADIPGLATGKRMWLLGQVVSSTGNVQYHYSFDDLENYASVHWTELGTIQAGSNPGTTIRVSDSQTVYAGTRGSGTASFAGRLFAVTHFRPGVAFDFIKQFSDDLGSWVLVGTADHVRPTSDDGDGSPIEDRDSGTPLTFGVAGFTFIPARKVYGTDRLIYANFLGGQFGAPLVPGVVHQENPIAGPDGWDVYPDRAITTHAWYQKFVVRTIVADADTADAEVSDTGHYAFGWLGLTIRGRADPITFPTSPQPDRLMLGCAENYTTWITDETYDRTIEQVRWSSLEWQRVLDDISQAKAVFPDELGGVECIAKLGNLEPWRYGLLIERDDQEVWRGPIITVGRRGNAIEVGAADVLARYQKRFLTRQVADYINTDAGEAFRQTIEVFAALPTDAWTFPIPAVSIGVAVTRKLNPRELKYAWDFLSELLDSSIDAYVMNGRIYIYEPSAGWRYQAEIKRTLDGPYNSNHDFVYGTFTEEAWSERPNWSIDGTGQANFVVVPTTDSGEYGFRSFEESEDVQSQADYGVLDLVDPDPLELPQDITPVDEILALQARAETLLALRGRPPIVIEGGTLASHAPIDVDNLRPGSLWKLDVYDQGYGHLLSVGRLRRVTVSVSQTDTGLKENVSVVLYPPGWEGQL